MKPESAAIRRCISLWNLHCRPEKPGLRPATLEVLRRSSAYVSHRLRIWDECLQKQQQLQPASEPEQINITLPDGRIHPAIKGVTTVSHVFRPERLANAILAQVDSRLTDVTTAILNDNCQVSLVRSDVKTPEALMAMWHSGAHLLGAAIELQYGDDALLADGPALKSGGFYYDALLQAGGTDRVKRRLSSLDCDNGCSLPSIQDIERDIRRLIQPDSGIFSIKESELEMISRKMASIAESKTPFVRLAISREEAFRMFWYSPLKLYFLHHITPNDTVTVYRLGDFIDLCRGPHVQHAGQLAAFRIISTSAARWDSHDATAPHQIHPQPLTRVTGIAFAQAKALQDWETAQAELKKRDHRVIGKAQSLFVHHPLAPGSAFLLPHGARIARRVIDYIRSEYRVCGFSEVVTPLLYHKELWEISGHWENYKEDMFMVAGAVEMESRILGSHTHDSHSPHTHSHSHALEIHGLKPMNCPGHCLLFQTSARSYRDLPIRFAEFSPLHRNEASGALTGLTRVRQFHQDDAHIFCTPSQILSEIESTLSLIHRTYTRLGFTSYELSLSTRPETNYMGDLSQWDAAETALKQALVNTGREWSLSAGRMHQTGTVQLDFQLPMRFDLKYQTDAGTMETPVIVHRAVIGSVERILAVLTEHHAGLWPFWLSPRQAIILPIKADDLEYADKVRDALALPDCDIGGQNASYWHRHYFVDVDRSNNLLAKKVLNAQAARYNFSLVVGKTEREAGSVRVRKRGGEDLGMMSIEQVLALFRDLEVAYK
ncbi:threonine---tRNA ligase [Synchytrium endobioticum]|uniref:threonine--tRNA ligase n=1 Tax=Synchytrium endobioticum TaxID=286115 RepID=A0A507DNM8_9FUNG|nr:threonine---tRNA ligase [Synchytrium endobioticum]